MASNPNAKQPTRTKNLDGTLEVASEHQLGDIALVAGVSSAERPTTRGIAVFWYPDDSVTIITTEPLQDAPRIMSTALLTLERMLDPKKPS